MSLVRSAADPGGAAAGDLLEREEELGAIAVALERARSGTGSLLVIEGPAGVGKSSLLAAAGEAAGAVGAPVLAAQGEELEQELPFGLAVRLLEPALERLGDRERAELLAGWAAPVTTLLANEAEKPVEGAPALIHGFYRAFAELIERRGPLLVLLDDLQVADRSSLRMLAYLSSRLGDRGAALVAALRTGEPAAPRRLLDALRTRASARLRPAPLSAAAVARFVRRSYAGSAADAFCAACGRVSGGNPFLLGELLGALRTDAVPATPAGAASLDDLVPDSVLLSTITRLGRLGDDAGRLAAAVAVQSAGAPLHHAALLAELSPDEAVLAADALVAAEIMGPGEPLAFTHPLIAAAVRAETPPFARARLHRLAAELLAEEGAPAERSAVHLLESHPGAGPWAVAVLRRAAARMLERGEPEAAVRVLQRALREPPSAGERLEVIIELGRAEAAAGQAAAFDRLAEALEQIDDPRRRAEILHELSRLALVGAQLAAAADLAERGLAELGEETAAPDGADPEPADPLGRRLLASFMTACAIDPALAERALPRARALIAASLAGAEPEDPELQARLAITMASDGLDRGSVRRLAERALAAHPLVEESGSATPFAFAVGALTYTDELDAAERAVAAARRHAEARGAVIAAATAHSWRAVVLLRRGSLAEAAREAELGLAARELDWRLTTELSASVLVRARCEAGDLEGARAALDSASRGDRQPLVSLLEARGLLRLAEGAADAALADLLAAGELFSASFGVRSSGTSSWRSHAAVASAMLGRAEDARRLAAEDLELARRAAVPSALGIALTASALAARGSESAGLLGEAVATLEGSPARLELARARVELGAALRRDGQRAAARAMLRRGIEQAERLGAVPLAARGREELRVAGARPRRMAISGAEALTASERRVAELAAAGRSNAEIGTELVVSRKTIEWHLGNVYRKLDISSRDDLNQFRKEK